MVTLCPRQYEARIFVYLGAKVPKIYVPLYETGVAIPPEFGCICGKNCKSFDCHHNAFEGPYYKDPPGIRSEASREIIKLFRGSRYNQFYISRCKHEAIQPTGHERAKRPQLDVIQQYLDETKILLDLDQTVHLTDERLTDNYDRLLWKNGFSWHDIGEKRNLNLERREASLELVNTISVIPAEVVTAALVYSVPEIAAKRFIRNPDQPLVAPVSWPKRFLREMVSTAVELKYTAGEYEIEVAA